MFVENCFFSHNFGSKYARKPIKGSKDAECSLVPKRYGPKNGPLGLRPGLGKIVHKCETWPTCGRYPQRTSNFKLNSVLSIEIARFPESVESSKNSLAAGELLPKMYRPSQSSTRVLKGVSYSLYVFFTVCNLRDCWTRLFLKLLCLLALCLRHNLLAGFWKKQLRSCQIFVSYAVFAIMTLQSHVKSLKNPLVMRKTADAQKKHFWMPFSFPRNTNHNFRGINCTAKQFQ